MQFLKTTQDTFILTCYYDARARGPDHIIVKITFSFALDILVKFMCYDLFSVGDDGGK